MALLTTSEGDRHLIFQCPFGVFPFDSTAQQWLNGFSPNLHQKTLRCYLLIVKIDSAKFWGSKHQFFYENLDLWSSDGRCVETRRNCGKTKTTGVTAISRLPSHTCLVKFGLTYRGFVSCAFLPVAHGSIFPRHGM